MDDIRLAKQIVEKMRRMFCFGKYRDIMRQKANVHFTETDDGFRLDGITFDFYDRIVVTPGKIRFMPEHG